MKNFLNRFEIFQNKVGRPSNETLKKRKIFYGIAIGICILLVGGMVGFLAAFSTNKLSGGLFDFLKPQPADSRFVITHTNGYCYKITPPKGTSSYQVQLRHKKSWINLYNKEKFFDKTYTAPTEICLQKEEYDPEYQAIYVKANTGKARDWKPAGGRANLKGWAYKEYKIDWPPEMPSRKDKDKLTTTGGSRKTFIVKFEKGNAQSIGNTLVSCSTSASNCNVTLPSITPQSGYDVVGWEVKGEGARYKAGSVLNIDRNLTMVAITNKKPSTGTPNTNNTNKFLIKQAGGGKYCYDVYPPKGVKYYRVGYWARKAGTSSFTKNYYQKNFQNGEVSWHCFSKQYSNVEDHAIYVKAVTGNNDTVWGSPNTWKPDGAYANTSIGWAIKEYKNVNFGGSTPPKTTPAQPTKPVSDNGIDGITKTVSQAYIDRLNKVDLSSYHHKSGWPANRWRTTYYYDDAKKSDSRFKYDTKHNWYTINGELAVASATTKYGKHGETKKIYYFTYGKDETIFIKFRDYPSAGDKWYRARVVDDCGACTKVTQYKKDTQLLDVLTKSSSTGNHVIDVAIPKH